VIENRGRVLLIEDEPELLDTLAYLLESEGYAVSQAVDGEQALALAREIAPDLVLCDFNLPGRSGADVVARVRELRPSARIIVMSGHLGATQQAQCAEAGATGFLAKPFTVVQLRVALELAPLRGPDDVPSL
jgi:CheY-like chemotaxis protein